MCVVLRVDCREVSCVCSAAVDCREVSCVCSAACRLQRGATRSSQIGVTLEFVAGLLLALEY